jgi:hypothetical protein
VKSEIAFLLSYFFFFFFSQLLLHLLLTLMMFDTRMTGPAVSFFIYIHCHRSFVTD